MNPAIPQPVVRDPLLVAPWREVLQALDFQNHEPPRISGICDVMVTVTVTVPVSRRLPNRPRATPERGRLPTVPLVHSVPFDCERCRHLGDRSCNRV